MEQEMMGGDAAGGDPAAGGGLRVCIDCKADGTYSVSSEPLAEEMGETGESSEGAGQPASSIGEALKMALELIKAAPREGASPDENFRAGLAGGGGMKQPAPMPGGYA